MGGALPTGWAKQLVAARARRLSSPHRLRLAGVPRQRPVCLVCRYSRRCSGRASCTTTQAPSWLKRAQGSILLNFLLPRSAPLNFLLPRRTLLHLFYRSRILRLCQLPSFRLRRGLCCAAEAY
jgi:hypothetical protein